MNKTFCKNMKATLLAQKNELMSKANNHIDIDTDGDETDEIQANILIQLNKQLHIRNTQKLNQIEEALQRIEDSSYGKCEDCDELIPEKRLLLNPHFQTCVSCAEEREMEVKQRKRF